MTIRAASLNEALGLADTAPPLDSLRALIAAWRDAHPALTSTDVVVLLRTIANEIAEGTMPDMPYVTRGTRGGLHVAGRDPRQEIVARAQGIAAREHISLSAAVERVSAADPALAERVMHAWREES